MRTFLLAILVWTVIGNAVTAPINSEPPIVFSVQPEEDGKLVYMPVAPQTKSDQPSNLFGLRTSIQNNGRLEVRLTNMRIIFTYADRATFAKQFARDRAIPSLESRLDFLAPEEAIQLTQPAPISVEIQLFCDGYALPKSVTRALAPYEVPVPGGYMFPGSESDLPPDVYWSHKDPHSGESQFFGYDLKVVAWDGSQFSSIIANGESTNNEHHVGWGIPVYAMADGVVIHTSYGLKDNPTAGTRVIQRMDDHSGSGISDVKITKLLDERMASVVRSSSGNLQITVWDVEDIGREITQRASYQGPAVSAIATDGLTTTQLVTAVRTAAGNLRVALWAVLNDGATLDEQDAEEAGAVDEVSVLRMTDRLFATAVRAQSDTLRLIIWKVADDGLTFSLLSEASAGEASSISPVKLNNTRLATALRTSGGDLKVIVWELLDDGATIDRRGENTGDQIISVAAVSGAADKIDTAMQTAAGDLKLVRWGIYDDGETVSPPEVEVSAGTIQGLTAVATGFDEAVITSVITEGGNLKNILWKPDGESFMRWGEEEAGAINRLSIDHVDGGVFLTGVRLTDGDLKLIAWWVGSGGGNNVVILHGNARTLYAHFRDGSLNPAVAYPGAIVTAGQYLGRMGNSGSSSGPHTHIHAERVPPFLTVEEIITLDAAKALPLLGPRPIPFHCGRAKRLSAVAPGDNPASTFSAMQGHGVYFTEFAIRPTWFKEMYVDWSSNCILPTGHKDCVTIGLLDFYGPFPTVNQALTWPACLIDTLFIRGGTYDENVTFNRPMTVRSYDGVAEIR